MSNPFGKRTLAFAASIFGASGPNQYVGPRNQVSNIMDPGDFPPPNTPSWSPGNFPIQMTFRYGKGKNK